MALTPPSAGLALRYRVGAVAGISAGATISAIPDESGNGNPDAAQSTAAKRPVAASVTVNGKTFWVADFDGTDDGLNLSGTALAATQNASRVVIFTVAASDVATVGLRYAYMSSSGSSVTAARSHVAVTDATANDMRVGGRRLDADAFTGLSSTDNGLVASTYFAWTGDHDYNNSDLFLLRDGTVVASNTAWLTAGSTSNTAAMGAAIGARAGSDGNYWNGQIAEVLVYKDTCDRAAVHSYIQDTYGITVADYVPSGVTVSAGLSGTGTLSTAQSAAVTRSAALSGTGTLSTAQSAAVTRAGALDGTGTLSTAQSTAVTRAGALDGAGTLSATSLVSRSAALDGTGTLAGSGTAPSVSQAAALSGTGTLAGSGTAPSASQAAALSGTGSLTAAQTSSGGREAALSGAGTLTAAQTAAFTRAGALDGSGTLTAAQTAAVTRSGALSGAGTLDAAALGKAAAALSGTGTLSATALGAGERAAALSGAGSLTASSIPSVIRAAGFTGSGTLAATQRIAVARTAALSGAGSLLAKAVFRFSGWTGVTWLRSHPKVWNGSRWLDDRDALVVTYTEH